MMSHIPEAAMPHAKTHEPKPAPAKPVAKRFPWRAAAAGGLLALGAAIGAVTALRPKKRPLTRPAAKPRRRARQKS